MILIINLRSYWDEDTLVPRRTIRKTLRVRFTIPIRRRKYSIESDIIYGKILGEVDHKFTFVPR